MDAAADHDRLYIRSTPSGSSENGLCQNAAGMLDTLDAAHFDDIILETVGTGQTNHGARHLVDAFVLTLMPDSGDLIQMMKAGVMELADIYVVNKSDLPGAARTASEVRSVLAMRGGPSTSFPPVILTSIRTNTVLMSWTLPSTQPFVPTRTRGKRDAGTTFV